LASSCWLVDFCRRQEDWWRGILGQQRETIAKPLSEREKRRRDEKLRKELESPYRKWLNEDVTYIITDEERAAFKRLSTDDEREQFIEQFWMRRDPTPDSAENEFKEEHYRALPTPTSGTLPVSGLEDRSRPDLHYVRPARRKRIAPFGRFL